jgi:uncharacterized protein (TIRG00374 family)
MFVLIKQSDSSEVMDQFKFKVCAKLTISVLLLLLVFRMTNWREVLPLFFDINFTPLVLMIALYPLSLWISSEKWRLLLRSHDVKVASVELFRHYWSGAFLNNFMPSSIGGDVGRVALLQRFGRPAEVAASVVVERLTGLLVLLAVGNAALFLRPDIFHDDWRFVFWLVAVGGLCALVGCFFLSGRISDFLMHVRLNERHWTGWFATKLKKVTLSICHYRKAPWILVQNIFLSVIFYLLSVVGHYVLFMIFALNVGVEDIFFVAAWISLISFVPLSLNSLGITEGAFVVLYGTVGVLPSEALAAALMVRFVGLVVSSFGGLFLLLPATDRKS